MTCVFIGDSIAYGVAQARPDCKNLAVTGRTTGQTLLHVHAIPSGANRVMISVGANDLLIKKAVLKKQLQQLRSQLGDACVVWLLPPNYRLARQLITELAGNYGDQILDVKPFASTDGVHPTRTGYRQLATETKSSACEMIMSK